MPDPCDDGSSTDQSMSSKSDDSLKKKRKKHKKKSSSHKSRRKEKKRERKKSKKRKKDRTRDKVKTKSLKKEAKEESDKDIGPEPPADLEDERKRLAPMSKEEWEAKQKEVRRVLDEETGRYRLVRGTGEILEEIVSKERHKEINRQATMADANYFQSVISKRI